LAGRRHRFGLVVLLAAACGCGPKKPAAPAPPPPAPAPAPLQPKQTVVVLLPDPEGKSSSVTVANAGGTQTLSDPYQAVRLQDANTSPGAPFTMDQVEVRRVFAEVIDTLPTVQASFVLYFDGDSDALNAESRAKIPAILTAIRERRSTWISVIGHTDTKATPKYNVRLGFRRADGVSKILQREGVAKSSISVESHGDADLAVKTPRGKAERLNRRVEVTVQ
jgi:peptidoglycan-associated lipoprotein